jgi:hypothetical protein
MTKALVSKQFVATFGGACKAVAEKERRFRHIHHAARD